MNRALCGVIGLMFFIVGCREIDADRSTEILERPVQEPGIVYARGRVDIEGGLIRLASSYDGIVMDVQAEEGARVQAGQILAVIDDRQARLDLAVFKAEHTQAKASAVAVQVRLQAALRELARTEALARAEGAARAELEQAMDLVAQLRAEQAAAQAAADTAETRVQVARHVVERHTIRAPLAGRIVKRYARLGDGVSTLNVTPLFVFAPDAPRIVRIDLDELYIDQVAPGMMAEVVIETETTHLVTGKVLRVGDVFGTKAPTGEPGERIDQRVVECVVAIDDASLRIGQRVMVRIKS